MPGEVGTRPGVLVVGGGAAGVAAGRRLVSRGVPAVVLERAPVLGGVAGTFRVGGWRFDVGLHCFFTSHPHIASEIDSVMGAAHRRHPLRELLWYAGRWRPYPPLRNLACYPDPSADLGRAVRAAADGRPATDAEAAARSLVGDRLSEWFVLPRLRAYWGTDPAALPASVVRGAVARADEIRSGAVAPLDQPPRRSWHYPVSGGFAGYMSRLSRGVPVRFGARVAGIDTGRRELRLAGRREPVRYEHLVCSVPLPELAAMATDLPADLAAAAARLRHSSVTLISLAVPAATPPAPWVYTWDAECPWYRATFPVEFDPTAALPGTATVQTETYWRERAPDPRRLVRAVVHSLRDLSLLPPGARVLAHNVRTVRYAGTFAAPVEAEVVAELVHWFAERNVTCVGRYGRWDNARFDQVLDRTYRLVDDLVAGLAPGNATVGSTARQ